MSVRPRKKVDLKISQNKAYQIILSPLVTEKSTQQSEFNKIVFSVAINATKQEIKSSIEKIFGILRLSRSNFLNFFTSFWELLPALSI